MADPRFSGVVVGGCIGAALDITFALCFAGFNGASPVRLLQTVASGALGAAAFGGGVPVAALGLLLHLFMSLAWAAAYLVFATRVAAAVRHPVIAGVVFGTAVFLGMRLVVLPLSAFPYPINFKPLATTLDLLSHMLLFGVPIAWAIHRALLRTATRS